MTEHETDRHLDTHKRTNIKAGIQMERLISLVLSEKILYSEKTYEPVDKCCL